jgi:hypothetical protein
MANTSPNKKRSSHKADTSNESIKVSKKGHDNFLGFFRLAQKNANASVKFMAQVVTVSVRHADRSCEAACHSCCS